MAYSDSQVSISLSLCNTCAKLGLCSSANKCNTKSILFCYKCYLSVLPYFSLNNFKFKLLNNTSVDCDVKYDDYLSPSKLSKVVTNTTDNDFILLHFNVRSLPKNKDKIEEMISDSNRLPHAIAIFETKLKEESTINVNLPGYRFFRNNSPTPAGGVRLYLKEPLQYRVRTDLLLEANKCEDL